MLREFYRYENCQGRGAYDFDESPLPGLVNATRDQVERWPMPPHHIRWSATYHRYGFTSMEQADRWFNAEERRALAEFGFKLKKLEVPKDVIYWEDDHQAAILEDYWLAQAPVEC